jgi:asparagine synthase (glutamine-hydrolysing)
MNCPDNQKVQYPLYRHFLAKLSRCAAEVADANVGLPPITSWHGLRRAGSFTLYTEWLPSNLKIRLKAYLVSRTPYSYGPRSTIIRCMRDQLKNCDALRVHLDCDALEDVIDNCRNHSRYELNNLFSVTSLIEYLERGRSTLEEYRDAYFNFYV